MDWFAVAQNDWDVYQDAARIQKFVDYGKITSEQYNEIVNQEQPAPSA
jgi:Phage uncharacterised protein (Phage_XkdX)